MADTPLSRLELLMQGEDYKWFQEEKVSAERRLKSTALAPPVLPEQDLITSDPTNWKSNQFHSILSISGSDHGKPLSKKPARLRESAKKLGISEMAEPDPQGRVIGQLTDPDEFFCPLMAVSKYPYKFLAANSATCEKVSQLYFASGKFWDRKWTVHYIHPSFHVSPKPQFLVPFGEVKALFDEINGALNLQCNFPDRPEYQGFLISFSDDGTPRPRFLGISSTRNTFTTMENNVPKKTPLANDQDAKSKEIFDAKMMAVTMVVKNKPKRTKDRKKVDRIREKKSDCRALKRTQRYFGLRLRESRPKKDNAESDKWNLVEAVDFQAEYVSFSCEGIDVRQPVAHPFENDVLFVCIDIEADELDHSKITEIGVSTLDTKELAGIAPGEGGINWMAKIRARHFRINEYKHVVNSRFINGCPDRFEACFGSSEFIRNDQAKEVVRSFFVPPYAASIDHNGFYLAQGVSSNSQASEKRIVVLVGHDIKTDISYLKGMGYNPVKEPGVLEVLDTGRLYRALNHEQQVAGLANVMTSFNLMSWNMHNAGNDAVYTLQALVAIVFKAATQTVERISSGHEGDNEEEWKSACADSCDGGDV